MSAERTEQRREREPKEKPPALVWPDPCHDCRNHPGLRELAWHHADRAGKPAVTTMMVGCDCPLGAMMADRARSPDGRRILGTLREVWDRLAARREHVALYKDPTIAQRTPPTAPRSTPSQAIAFVKATVVRALEERRQEVMF
jgi:hypothetical protein